MKKFHPKPKMHSYSCWLTTRGLKSKMWRLSCRLSMREQQLCGASTETMLSSSASALPERSDNNKTRGSLNSEAWRASSEMLWSKTRSICHLWAYSEGHPMTAVRKAGLPSKVRFSSTWKLSTTKQMNWRGLIKIRVTLWMQISSLQMPSQSL